MLNHEESSCLLGNEALLCTSLEGFPNPVLKLFRDQQEIVPNNRISLNCDADVVKLLIKNVSLEDSGKYRIEATNEVGSDAVEFSLSVIGKLC